MCVFVDIHISDNPSRYIYMYLYAHRRAARAPSIDSLPRLKKKEHTYV